MSAALISGICLGALLLFLNWKLTRISMDHNERLDFQSDFIQLHTLTMQQINDRLVMVEEMLNDDLREHSQKPQAQLLVAKIKKQQVELDFFKKGFKAKYHGKAKS